MNEPEHEGFVYQVIVNGTMILVMADYEDAQRYIQEKFKGVAALILPTPVFKYGGGKK